MLVHIPLELYPYFFKSVLSLIFDEISPLEKSAQAEDDFDEIDDDSDQDPGYKQPAFLNVSITPVEVSVICPRRLVEKYFNPLIQELGQLDSSLQSRLGISQNDYIAMQVLGQGLEAGKRVLELTSPLALAGMYVETSGNPISRTDLSDMPVQLHFLHLNLLLRLYSRSTT